LPKWVGFKPSPNGRFWIGLPHYVFPNLEWTNFWIELFCHDLCEVMWSMSPFLARSPSDYDHKSFHDHSEFISYDVTWTCWKMSDANQKDSIQCSSLKWPPLRIHWMNSPNLEPRTHTDPNSDLASEFGKVELPNSPYGVLNFKTIPKLAVKVSNTSQTSSLPLLFPGSQCFFYISPLYAACAAWPHQRTGYSTHAIPHSIGGFWPGFWLAAGMLRWVYPHVEILWFLCYGTGINITHSLRIYKSK